MKTLDFLVRWWKTGEEEKISGTCICDALEKAGYDKLDLAFLEFFKVLPFLPIPVEKSPTLYQIYYMKSRENNWESVGKPSESFYILESYMKNKVRRGDFFSGILVNLSTEKVISWVW